MYLYCTLTIVYNHHFTIKALYLVTIATSFTITIVLSLQAFPLYHRHCTIKALALPHLAPTKLMEHCFCCHIITITISSIIEKTMAITSVRVPYTRTMRAVRGHYAGALLTLCGHYTDAVRTHVRARWWNESVIGDACEGC